MATKIKIEMKCKECGATLYITTRKQNKGFRTIYLLCMDCLRRYRARIRDDGEIIDFCQDEVFKKRPSTLCWDCQRSYIPEMRCSWAKDFTPVEGWNAEFRPVNNSVNAGDLIRETPSYLVKECPRFVSDDDMA